jgi:hypothetical protein
MNNELLDKIFWQARDFARRQQMVDADFLEKYAELIVKECMEQVWYTREDGINGNVSEVIKDRIKEHFGVEE